MKTINQIFTKEILLMLDEFIFNKYSCKDITYLETKQWTESLIIFIHNEIRQLVNVSELLDIVIFIKTKRWIRFK